MARRELLKKELDSELKPAAGPVKIAGFSGKVFGIVKFLLGVCLLPFVYAVSVAYFNEFSVLPKSLQNNFWAGIITLVIIYLFVWEPMVIYAKGQKILEAIFRFFTPLVRVAPYLLPIYLIVFLVSYWVFSYMLRANDAINYFIFLFGFSIALHLIFSAKSLRAKQGDFLKANYIFGFSFIYILNVALLAFFLNLIFNEFSFVNFSNNSFQIAKSIFYAVFKQLFLR